MLNIVIPMAGRGSRFSKAGYKLPKPLIEIHGHPMIEYVTKNITPKMEHRFIYICLKEHMVRYDLGNILKRISPGCKIITTEAITEGAACTVILAKEYINNDDGLMIANSDQYVDVDVNAYLKAQEGFDGLIMTMKANDMKWSFIQYDEKKNVLLVKEKEVISDEATVGIYNYKQGKTFVKYAQEMIESSMRVNGEFYVAPVYNKMIENGKKVTFFNIGSEGHGMYGLGVPEDLNNFIENDLSHRIFS